jgi:tetratricopeptide (TPR) repeat protein
MTEQTETASQSEDYQTMLQKISDAFKIAPLNWELYYKRGFAEAASHSPRAETLRDFAIARYLLPNWAEVYLKEGQVWAAAGEPDFAFDVWWEGMQRLPQEATHLYDRIFAMIKSEPALVDRWRQLGEDNKECLLIYFRSADRIGFEIELERLLSDDRQLRSFTSDELHLLFRAWYEKGDKLRLAQTLQEHQEWQQIAWRELARAYGDYQDYRQAYETAQKFVPHPELPQPNSQESVETLKTRFMANRTNPAAGLALYSAQMREGQVDNALVTLHEIATLRGAPKSLSYLEAEARSQNGQWKEAWEAMKRFAFTD